MSDPSTIAARLSSEVIGLFADMLWPAMLLSASGQVLALNRPLRDLRIVDEMAVVGRPVDRLVPLRARRRVRALLAKAASGHPLAPLATRLIRPGDAPAQVELEIIAVPDDRDGRLIIIVHPISLAHRHGQLILELNRLAPALLTARAPDDVFRRVAQTLEPPSDARYGWAGALPGAARSAARAALADPDRRYAGRAQPHVFGADRATGAAKAVHSGAAGRERGRQSRWYPCLSGR